MKEELDQTPQSSEEVPTAVPPGLATPASDEEVAAAVEAFFAKYRRALERLGTC